MLKTNLIFVFMRKSNNILDVIFSSRRKKQLEDCLTKEKTENMITKCLKSQVVVFMGKSWEKRVLPFKEKEERSNQKTDIKRRKIW
jgi:hypothetical protein